MSAKIKVGRDFAKIPHSPHPQSPRRSARCFNICQGKLGQAAISRLDQFDRVVTVPYEQDVSNGFRIFRYFHGTNLGIEWEIGEIHLAAECDRDPGAPYHLAVRVDSFESVQFKRIVNRGGSFIGEEEIW